jgi:hypothetical protein
MTKSSFSGFFGRLAAFLCLVAPLLAAAPARADRCDELAQQLKAQIDGLTIGKAAVNQIELKHPAVSRAALGCASRNITNEVFAVTNARKPAPAFYDFVGRASAQVFTVPLDDARNGAARCLKRIGLIRGYSVATRYRRLDVRCSWNKGETMVSISREKDS